MQDERVDPADDDNFAIQLSSLKGHLEIVKLLLQHPKVMPCNKIIAFLYNSGYNEILELLKRKINK